MKASTERASIDEAVAAHVEVSATVKIGVFGSHLGATTGFVVSQGEVLGSLLRGAGHEVVSASKHPRRLARAADTLATIISTGRSLDVAVVSVFSGPAFGMAELAVAALKPFRVPVVLTLRGGNLPDFSRRHQFRVRRLLTSVATVVAPSAFLARTFRELRPDVRVISNALPLDSYPVSTRSSVRGGLLWMRAFDPVYRPDVALKVLAHVRRTFSEITLTMAGQNGGLLESTKQLAADLDLADAVRFVGFLDPNAKFDAFRNHDVFLSTNAIDNAPVSVLEAAASGLIVVGMDAGGLGDLLAHRDSALLVPSGDVAAMAEAVAAVRCNPSLATRLSRGGQLAAAPSSRESVLRSWEFVLTSVKHG